MVSSKTINITKAFKLRFLPFLLGLPLLAFFLAYNLKNPSHVLLNTFAEQLTFLGFIVALAAYLASIARELIKTLNALAETDEKRKVTKLDLGWVSTAEFHLVVIGAFTSARIVLGPTCDSKNVCIAGIELIELDFFLMIYLALILLLLAGLHVRQWVAHKPWET